MTSPHLKNKLAMTSLRTAMRDFSEKKVRRELEALATSDAVFHMCHPFGDMTGPHEFYDGVFRGLLAAWPDLERRDYIVMAGPDDAQGNWVGCAGYYTGVFQGPWLGIPPTGHQVAMRFHEFYRFTDDRVVEFQALWDIPEVMMQANAWPMAPSLGREWQVPGPATQDGIDLSGSDEDGGRKSCRIVVDMLEHLKLHPAKGGPQIMELERFWHPRMNWYGPSGIGTGRGIAGFRNWHQIPFLNAMPDRGRYVDDITYHFFGEGDYAAVTGWPNMIQTLSDDGWMGIAPSGRRITMRSLDFWRIENGLIRENWVLVDLLDAWQQLGVDVFARLAEFNKARNISPIDIPNGMNT